MFAFAEIPITDRSMGHRLRADRCGALFASLLTDGWAAVGLQVRHKLATLGSILANDPIGPTGAMDANFDIECLECECCTFHFLAKQATLY